MEATLTLVTFKIGMVLFIVGLLFIMFPPKNINSFYGYRTTNSRRNLDTWKVANSYSAILMTIEGLILSVIGLLTTFFNDNKAIETALGVGHNLHSHGQRLRVPDGGAGRWQSPDFDAQSRRHAGGVSCQGDHRGSLRAVRRV